MVRGKGGWKNRRAEKEKERTGGGDRERSMSREKEEENVCGRNYVTSYIAAVNLESSLYIYNSNSFILFFHF